MKMALTIVADIGGTNSRLAQYANRDLEAVRIWPSSEFKSFEALLKTYLRERGLDSNKVNCLSIGVAGTVEDGVARGVNLPWTIDAKALKEEMGARVYLLNDFEAAAWGVTALKKEELFELGGVRPREGTRCVLGAGTGLGEAIIVSCETKGFHILPTEGGHTDFAPMDEDEWGLYRFLQKRFGHVSVERVVSGPGIQHMYEYFKGEVITPKEVVERALVKGEDAALKCMRLFIRAYAREAADLALKTLAFGGVYIAGGIAPKIKEAFLVLGFRGFFEDKGRMKKVLKEIPVFICLHPYLGLLGAGIRSDRGPM